jgi:hypothetical protein
MMRFKGMGRRVALGGLVGGGLAATLAAPALVRAQGTYPSRPVRYINPYPAGGPTDTLSRLFCARMSELTGQQWIVENRGGAGGNVGMDALAKSEPDGYSLGLGGIAAHAIAPTLYAKLPFNARTDFTFVTTIWWLPNLLAVNLDLPAKSVPELIELCRNNPGKYSYGSAGAGTTLHLSGELFKTMAKVDIQHVPYRGSAPATQDLLAGQIHMMFDNIPGTLTQDHAVRPGEAAAGRHCAALRAVEAGARDRRAQGQVRRPRLDRLVDDAGRNLGLPGFGRSATGADYQGVGSPCRLGRCKPSRLPKPPCRCSS